jgi:tetratricopeptide (TPR) repeat protein
MEIYGCVKELYGWVGAPYPRLSTAIVAFICGALGAGIWSFIGWQYAKDRVQTTVAPTQKPKQSEQYEPGPKEAASANYKATLDQAREALDKLEGEFSPQELAQAYEGLEKGDPSDAETLFRRILATSGFGSREKAFTAAFILAELAERHGDYQAASRYNKQATELKPSGDTVQSHGWVGDDTPKVIVALKTIPESRRTISGINEATGIDERIIREKLHSLENNGSAEKSGKDVQYWNLTRKGMKVFADLK